MQFPGTAIERARPIILRRDRRVLRSIAKSRPRPPIKASPTLIKTIPNRVKTPLAPRLCSRRLLDLRELTIFFLVAKA
jgi:hypothetical protein